MVTFNDFDFSSAVSDAISGRVTESDLARDDFSKFAELVLEDERTGQPIDLQAFQREVIDALLDPVANIILLVLPRGFGKSSLVTVGFGAWLIGNDPNIRIIVASNAEDQAVSHLTGIENIMSSAKYQEVFGDLIPRSRETQWSQRAKVVKRTRSMRHPTLLAAGVGSAIVTGKRSDIILGDDLIDVNSAMSAAERESSWTWFTTALQDTLDPTGVGKTIIIQTRYHQDDVAGRMKENYKDDPRFRVVDIPALALETDEETGETVEKSIWEDRFSTEWLMERRRRSYFAFQANFMNDPIDVSRAQLSESWLNYVPEEEVIKLYPEMEFFAGVDPNTSRQTMKTDYFAMVVVGIHHPTNRIFVVDAFYSKADIKTIKELFKGMMTKWKPTKVTIESNGAQILYETLFQEDNEYLQYPFSMIFNTLQKEERILSMATSHFMNGKVAMPGVVDERGYMRPIMSLMPIRQEWLSFPQSRDSHFDALDALDMALRPLVRYNRDFAISVLSYDEWSDRMKAEQTRRALEEQTDTVQGQIEQALTQSHLLGEDQPYIEEEEDDPTDEEIEMLEQAYRERFKPKLSLGIMNRRLNA